MRLLLAAMIALAALPGCSKKEEAAAARPAVDVTVVKAVPRDTPVAYEFVGQTESSHQVQIRARVNGFLERRVYTEGTLVKAGQVMFPQDPKPFQAALHAAKGALAQQQARLLTAAANLARVKPLVAQNALSQKDLDDATGQEQAAAAAVETAKAQVEEARLNLGYTTITTPVTGLSSFARVQDGAYVNAENSLLTSVDQVDPIWINFSLSENDVLQSRGERDKGRLRAPKDDDYEVEAVLADGTTFGQKGRITFRNAAYNQQTGTFLVRATLPNPSALLRPGQFVRVRVHGMVRPNAILVPQQAVQNGAQGHFVYVVKDGKAEVRPIKVGPWKANEWFIDEGLAAGDLVVVDGMMKLGPGATVKVAKELAPGEPLPGAAPAAASAQK